MQTNQKLITEMISKGVLQTPKIINAFEKINRKYFVLQEFTDLTYIDRPLPIGKNQTISQPSTVAFMLEQLQVKEGDKVLDIGSGSAWTTSLLCYLAGEKGSVTGLERVDELVIISQKNLSQFHFGDHCKIQKASETLGIPGEKFDKILVSASASEIPEELFTQLKVNGTLLIPIKNSIFKFTKINETHIESQEFPGFVFVPLIVDKKN